VGCATGRRKVVSAASRTTLVGSKDNGGEKGLFFYDGTVPGTNLQRTMAAAAFEKPFGRMDV